MCRVQYPSQEQQCWYWGVLSRNQIAAPEIILIAYSDCSDPSEMAIESMECSHSSDSPSMDARIVQHSVLSSSF